MSSFIKSFTFKKYLRKYTVLSSILLLSLSGIIVYATFPTTGPSSVNKSLLPINVFNSLISNSCGSNSGPITSISNVGGVTCGKNPNFTSGISNITSGGITFPSGPGGSTAGTLMTAFKKFLSSTCPSGEYIVGTKADGSKACSVSSSSSVASLSSIINQGISYPTSGLSGANKNGTIGAKLTNFFNSTCTSNQYLAGINADGSKVCSPKPIDGGWSSFSPSSCPTTCGQPASSLTRTCTNPTPAYGGSDCVGSSTSSCPATASCCTPDGTYTYGSCSVSGACGQTGTKPKYDSCGSYVGTTSCSTVACCIPNGSCNAVSPACGQTTSGVDNCNNSCIKTGNPCIVNIGGGGGGGCGGYDVWTPFGGCMGFFDAMRNPSGWTLMGTQHTGASGFYMY